MAAPRGTVLWLADLGALPDGALDRYEAWLDEGERQRCQRFVRAGRRRQFLAGRALLRRALATLLGGEPAAVRLEERPGQAPALVHP
ncbi:MAG: 4'-phosphopantetheinyl transferase family protein, partial [Telluria sp.]